MLDFGQACVPGHSPHRWEHAVGPATAHEHMTVAMGPL
jgi:hypothetical protein